MPSSYQRSHLVMRDALIAILIVVLTSGLSRSITVAQTLTGEPDPSSIIGHLLEQGGLAVMLALVLWFYRRDFAQQHAQMLQNQAILMKALNDHTAATTASSTSNALIASTLAEMRRDLHSALGREGP